MIRPLETASVAAILVAIGLSTYEQACSGAQTGTAVQAGVNLAVCVLGVVAKDWGEPAATVAADALATCGSDAATIAPLLDQSTKVILLAHSASDAGH
jgi:hypothetical protein